MVNTENWFHAPTVPIINQELWKSDMEQQKP